MPSSDSPPLPPEERPADQPDDIPPFTPKALPLLATAGRRWLIALPLGLLLAAATAAVVWLLVPPGKYVASIKLYMPMHPQGILHEHPEATADFESFQRTQIALLKSRLVLNAALGKPKVRALDLDAFTKTITPAEWLEEEVRVEMPEGPELPRVTISSDDPEQAKVLVTAVVDAYMEEIVQKQTAHRQARLDQLKDIARTYASRLKRIQDAHNQQMRLIGRVNASPWRRELVMQELLDCQRELRRARVAKVVAEVRSGKGGAGQSDEVAFLTAQEKLLGAEKDRLQAEAEGLADQPGLGLDSVQLELRQAEESFAVVMKEIDGLTVEMPAPPRVSRLEEATIITPNDTPRKLKLAALGGLGAFAAFVLLVGLIDLRWRRKITPSV